MRREDTVAHCQATSGYAIMGTGSHRRSLGQGSEAAQLQSCHFREKVHSSTRAICRVQYSVRKMGEKAKDKAAKIEKKAKKDKKEKKSRSPKQEKAANGLFSLLADKKAVDPALSSLFAANVCHKSCFMAIYATDKAAAYSTYPCAAIDQACTRARPRRPRRNRG